MIDLHSHLLHSVDDGSGSLEESLALARIAVDDGIRAMALTPHIHPGRFGNRRSELHGKVANFQEELRQHGIPLEVRLGGEVRLGMESLELILEDEVPFLGTVDGYRVMLLEFPHQLIPVGSQQFVDKLLQLRIRPLIAHPERNKAIMARPERILPFVDAGCWLQITAGSIAGRFGETARDTAISILENGWAYVIASDAHNAEHRPPVLSEGRDAVAELLGEAMARKMVSERPARLLGL
ncbi:MAG: tyrosine-protein phosphatase [Bacteroidota bacterium]